MSAGGTWTGVIVGAIGLAVLDAVVSTQSAASNVGGTIAGLGGLVEKFLSPAVPAFTVTAASTSTTTAQPASTTPVVQLEGASSSSNLAGPSAPVVPSLPPGQTLNFA